MLYEVITWSLIFMYLWTGAHHLLWTPVPDWVQTLAMAFSVMLIAPSWGSVVITSYSIHYTKLYEISLRMVLDVVTAA